MKKNYLFTIIFSFLFTYSYSQITSFPHTTSFESSSEISATPSDASSKWTSHTSGVIGNDQSFSGTYTFTRNTGATPSSYTGPSSASDGDYYAYFESTGATSDKAEIVAIYDFSGRTGAQIDFKFHNYSLHGSPYGPATASLWVYNTETYTWKQNWVTTSNSNSWQTVSVDLSEYNGMIVQLWFTATSAAGESGTSGYQSDFALDNIIVSSNANAGVTTYYVDDSGSNSNNGLTSGAPFA
ncbi:MAG: hypothetical protein ACJ0O0_00420, partial [Flavobacteriaceae bacterium]